MSIFDRPKNLIRTAALAAGITLGSAEAFSQSYEDVMAFKYNPELSLLDDSKEILVCPDPKQNVFTVDVKYANGEVRSYNFYQDVMGEVKKEGMKKSFGVMGDRSHRMMWVDDSKLLVWDRTDDYQPFIVNLDGCKPTS